MISNLYDLLKLNKIGVLPKMFIFLIPFTQQALAVTPNENGKQGLDLDSFPSLYGPNSKLNVKTIAGLLNIADMSCAIKPNPQKPLIDTAPIELGDIATCKLNEAGLRDFVNAGAMKTFRQSVSRNISLFTDLIFDCAEYKAVSAIFSARHASVPLTANNLNSVMNNATRDCQTAHHIVSKDYPKTPKSYPDPYKENSQFLTNWTIDPNYPDNLLKEISSHLSKFIGEIDDFYQPYKNFDVLGVHLGQSLTDLSNVHSYLFKSSDIDNPSLRTSASQNFKVDYLHQFLKAAYVDGQEKQVSGDFIKVGKLTLYGLSAEKQQQLLDFYRIYQSLDEQQKIPFLNVLDILNPVLTNLPNYSYSWKANRNKQGRIAVRNNNLSFIEIHGNIFQQVSYIKITREFDGLVDLTKLSERLIAKYQGVGLTVAESGHQSIILNSYNGASQSSMVLVHRINSAGSKTELQYEMKTLYPAKEGAEWLTVVLEQLQQYAIKKHSNLLNVGKNIDI